MIAGGTYSTKPDAPTIGSATATGTTTATVAFTAPARNGGVAISSYTATSSPGGITGTLSQAGSGTITVTGLTTGTAYTFTVTATNSVGTSVASSASNSITTYLAPANTVAPVVSGTATVGQTLSTTNGTWNGIPTPTFAYQWQRAGSDIGSATSSTYVLVAADVGNAIRCVVTATNVVAAVSANSNATSSVAASVPGAPTIGTATATGATTATISFTAPASNGGATITSYTATSSPGGITGTLSQAGSGTITVSGLTAETSYTFTVRATNSVGQSAASAASNSITTAASYFIALSAYGHSQAVGSSLRVVGSSVIVGMNGAAAYGSVPALGVNTGTGANNYAVLGGSGSTIYPWGLQFYQPNSNITGFDIPMDSVIDSGSNLYAYGTKYGSGAQLPIMNKTNSSGSKQYGIQFGTTEFGGFNSVQFDQQGYMMGVGGYNGQAFFARISEGGSVVLARLSGTQINMSAGDSDSSGNLIVSGFVRDANGYQRGWVGKYDSGGTLIWGRYSTVNGSGFSSSNQSVPKCMKVVGSDIYIGGWMLDAGTNYGFMAKLSGTDGAVQWQRVYSNCSFFSVTQESDGSLYWGGTSGGSQKGIIIKTDTSGNEQLNRYVGSTGPSDYSIRLKNARAVISGSTMYIGGTFETGGAYAPIYFRVPSDGSKTGTYTVGGVSVVYGASYVSGSSASSLAYDSVAGFTFPTSFTTASESYSTSSSTSDTTTVTQI